VRKRTGSTHTHAVCRKDVEKELSAVRIRHSFCEVSPQQKAMSAASMTGLPERSNPTIFLALVERSVISAPNLPRCRLARSQRRVFDMRVYREAAGNCIEYQMHPISTATKWTP
jgi:hypothetical protein